MKLRLGIDLGGTKIEIVALHGNGQEVYRRRCKTPSGDYPATLRAIADLVVCAERELGVEGSVGLGTPGAESRITGRLKNSNSTCLNDRTLRADLESLLDRPIRIANDANCFALSEAADGAAAGEDPVFGVILGTGVGGGLVVNGNIVVGANAIAGEWGHNPLPWPEPDELPGPACYCGRHGCIETFLSGPGLTKDHARHFGETVDAATLAQRAESGDPKCSASLARHEQRLARALAHVINIVDPSTIVLGGGLSNCQRLYDQVPRLWKQFVFSDHVATRLVPPKHGDSSGVRGAAWLWS